MPFLVVGGVTVPVSLDEPEERLVEVGEVALAFDGTPRSSVRARGSEWRCETVPLSSSDATTLLSALTGAPPVSCSGDFLGGSVDCVVTDIHARSVKVAGGVRKRISFRLLGPP